MFIGLDFSFFLVNFFLVKFTGKFTSEIHWFYSFIGLATTAASNTSSAPAMPPRTPRTASVLGLPSGSASSTSRPESNSSSVS